MSKSLLSKEQIDSGYQRFLAENPSARLKLNESTQEIADILGVELSDLRRSETAKMLYERAAELGIEAFEYLLQLSVDNSEKQEKIRQARQDGISKAIGLS